MYKGLPNAESRSKKKLGKSNSDILEEEIIAKNENDLIGLTKRMQHMIRTSLNHHEHITKTFSGAALKHY